MKHHAAKETSYSCPKHPKPLKLQTWRCLLWRLRQDRWQKMYACTIREHVWELFQISNIYCIYIYIYWLGVRQIHRIPSKSMVSNILTMDSSVGWFNNVTHKTGEIDGDSRNSSKFVKMGSKNGGMVLDDPYVVQWCPQKWWCPSGPNLTVSWCVEATGTSPWFHK